MALEKYATFWTTTFFFFFFSIYTQCFFPQNILNTYAVRSDSLTLWFQAKTHSPIYPTRQFQVRKYQVEQICIASPIWMDPKDFPCLCPPASRDKEAVSSRALGMFCTCTISMSALIFRLVLS